ncbi:hypothetical protein [Sphingomonas sp.]|uniref:hypothetical protein n=1 Tax=Sphingomonas sp. TaxID=28214 RepID=UPI003752FCD9
MAERRAKGKVVRAPFDDAGSGYGLRKGRLIGLQGRDRAGEPPFAALTDFGDWSPD